MAAAQELHGAAFLQRRLARAQAVPAAERSPEVQAFITSVELGRQACELLPLRRGGGGGGETEEPHPSLPLGDPATVRRVLRAVLCLVQANHVSPHQVSFDRPVELHIEAYMPALQAAAAAGGSGKFAELAVVLDWYVRAASLNPSDSLAHARLVQGLVEQLCQQDTRAAISRQLQQLAAGEARPDAAPAVSAEQLLETCVCHLYRAAQAACSPSKGSPDSEAAQAVARFATCTLRLLSRSSMKRIEFETDQLVLGPRDAEGELHQLLWGLALAQQQRSDLWQCRFAVLALHLAGSVPAEVPPPLLARVADAFQQAQQAFKRCSRLLPEGWTLIEQSGFQLGMKLLPSVQARAQLARPSTSDEAAVANFNLSLVQMHSDPTLGLECAGCGKAAVGLRGCSRCRAARYCSRECQAAHWPQHKRECRPA